MSKISGPLLDRIDIHIEVPAVQYKELADRQPGTPSSQLRDQVIRARDVQAKRLAGTGKRCNAQMSSKQLRQHCKPDDAGQQLLKISMQELGLSARAHDKILRVARTIADLEDEPDLRAHHVSEAINYRLLDRKLWT